MAKIVVIGSANTDMVIRTPKFPKPGETILGGDFFMFAGGKGANQAVAAARLGGEMAFIGNLGQDIFGQQTIAQLREEGIDTQFLATEKNHPSGVALILVDAAGENEIVVAGGANNYLTNEHINTAGNAFSDAEIVLLQLEIPIQTVLYAAETAYQLDKKVILNPAPAQLLPGKLYRTIYLITPNETEAEHLTGVKVVDIVTATESAGILLERGVKNVIITMGAKGAFFRDHQTSFFVDAPLVKAIDTTAAGDVFNGAIAVEISKGSDWPTAISTACKAASISVTRMGAQSSMPYSMEVSG